MFGPGINRIKYYQFLDLFYKNLLENIADF